LYFPEENSKQLYQDEIIEILDQAKAPEWHETMVNSNIDIFEMIAERLPNLKSRKRLDLKPKLDSERSCWASFSKKLMHSKDN
jgi:hypothetical protein